MLRPTKFVRRDFEGDDETFEIFLEEDEDPDHSGIWEKISVSLKERTVVHDPIPKKKKVVSKSKPSSFWDTVQALAQQNVPAAPPGQHPFHTGNPLGAAGIGQTLGTATGTTIGAGTGNTLTFTTANLQNQNQPQNQANGWDPELGNWEEERDTDTHERFMQTGNAIMPIGTNRMINGWWWVHQGEGFWVLA